MKHVALAALLALVACKKSPGAVSWEKDPSKAADVVFERYLESTGGLEASRAIRNLRIRAESTIEAQQITMGMLILEERPDRSRIEATVPLLGTITSGYADGIAWEVSPLTGPRVKDGPEAEEARRSGRLDLYENWQTEWPERRVVGEAPFADVQCFQVSARTATGKAETMFFAMDDGRFMGTRSSVTTDMGELQVTNEVLEYGDVDGVSIPTVTRQTMGPAVITTRFVELETNIPEFPDLTPPPEILSLAADRPDPVVAP